MKPEERGAPKFESTHEFLVGNLQDQERPQRLAIRVAAGLSQVSVNIAEKLMQVAHEAKDRFQAAFDQHTANMSDANQAIATKLTYAEINRVKPAEQVALLEQGKDSTLVSEAAVGQRRMAPELQAAVVQLCKTHTDSMRTLAKRPDATLETLAVLVESEDYRTRLQAVDNFAARMRTVEPTYDGLKAEIYNRLIERYESDFSPSLVPVCQSSEQLREMYDKTDKVLGVVDVFVENPFTPDSVLEDIASSAKMQVTQHKVAQRAREALNNRIDLRETRSAHDDEMAPS